MWMIAKVKIVASWNSVFIFYSYNSVVLKFFYLMFPLHFKKLLKPPQIFAYMNNIYHYVPY